MDDILERILYVGLVGGAAGGAIAALLWAIERIRGRPLIELDKPTTPLTREEMIERLRAMADDPRTPPANREGALARLRAFESLDATSEEPQPSAATASGDSQGGRYSESPSFPALDYFELPSFGRLKMPHKRWLFGGAVLVAWGAFGWLQYDWANRRISECYDLLGGSQGAICVRNAIEARDFVITWAIGIPMGLLILALAVIWTIGQTRK